VFSAPGKNSVVFCEGNSVHSATGDGDNSTHLERGSEKSWGGYLYVFAVVITKHSPGVEIALRVRKEGKAGKRRKPVLKVHVPLIHVKKNSKSILELST
jgi:hypothetical protein